MTEAEDFFTDLVSAIAACVGASFRDMDNRVEGNFKARIAAATITRMAGNIPSGTRNGETIKAVYETFSAALNGKPEKAPAIPLPSSAAQAKARKPPSRPKRTS